MEMQINVNTKIIYMDSAVPVMRAIENVKRDIRKAVSYTHLRAHET